MTTPSMFSTPALVLTLGTSMLPAMTEVKRIFLQSDSRRGSTTRFLAVNLCPRKGEAGLIPLDEAIPMKGNSNSWKEIFEQTDGMIGSLKAGIQSALHELRSHEKLIEVGLGGKTSLPLDVYLLANLSEPDASALLKIIPLLQTLLMEEPYAALHLLLNIAVFGETSVSAANVYVTLKNLYGLLEAQKQFPFLQIYLFDRFKEGSWEAQDELEVQTILGNFLLALLSGGLAQHIAHQLPQMEMEEHRAFFCSASAALIVMDMEQLQKACARRLGQEIIWNEFHSEVDPNPGPIEELAGNFLVEHANFQVWAMRLCRDSLFHVHSGSGLEYHISDLQFEDVSLEDWAKTIQAYDASFKDKRLPAQCELLDKNSVELDKEFLKQLTAFAQALPVQARLYPGGIRSARLALERLRRALLESCPEPRKESHAEQVEEEWTEPIKTSLEWLENAIRTLPKPPRWILGMPMFLRRPAIQLFNLIYLHRELKTITDLRQASIRLLEKKYAALMDARLAQKISELGQSWIRAMDKHIRAVKRLQSMMDQIHERLAGEMSVTVSETSLFRLSAMNETLLAWAYYYGKRPQAGFRHTLLAERNFLNDWQRTNLKSLEERLMKFCEEVYQSLADTDLEQALSHRNGKDASDLALALSQGAVPLLRPNFDQMGSGPSYQMRFFQSREPRTSSILPILKSDMQEWMEISTQDPFVAICSRVRVMIPMPALDHLLERGRAKYEMLDEDQKAGFSLQEEQ